MTISVGQAFERLLGDDAPVRVIAWDGSTGGGTDGVTVRLLTSYGRSYEAGLSAAKDFPDGTTTGGGEVLVRGAHVGDRLSAMRGKKVVLVFYPGDFTPVCTQQLSSYAAKFDTFETTGAVLWGISSASMKRESPI